MLASDAPTLGCRCSANALKFWHLRISKTFSKPEYYIGQTVLHKMKVKQGEILHPVEVIGICWTGRDWQYAVELPEDHPWYQVNNYETEWFDNFQVELM
ncbi:hypothetical protein [Nostoc sp. PA-18-2419]|uniref:hypothetical protein n=1 Tax=Nostoc sp. PA-18-2419 TaxID=2575443 RepID=UPI001108CE23|nr:hypothetical protein [Nostoc sp. PA-18-2419]